MAVSSARLRSRGGSEGRDRYDCHSVSRAGVTDDQAAADLQRHIGHEKGELPVLAKRPSVGRVDELGGRAGRRDQVVGDKRDVPVHVWIELGQSGLELTDVPKVTGLF